MSLAVTEVFATPLRLSPRLVSGLGSEHSTLRAALQSFDSAVIVYVGGEIDACSEETWRLLLAEASAFAADPQLFIVDVNGVDFMSGQVASKAVRHTFIKQQLHYRATFP